MPWTESTKMDEKLKFVARYLDGESIAALCREFGISRVTGHKVIARYKESGMEALTDRSRRPYRQANQLPFQIEKLIVQLNSEKPHWGAPKIRERLLAHFPQGVRPAGEHTLGQWRALCQSERALWVAPHGRLVATPGDPD